MIGYSKLKDSGNMGYSCKETLSSWVHKFPTSTFKNLFQLIWPLFLSLLVRRFVGPINVAFAGRIGTTDLGAVGISYGLLTVTATGLGSGLATSFETMAAKAYGAGQYHTVGILLQKAFLFAGCLCFLVISLWMHVGGVLKLIGIPVGVAEKSEQYLLMYIPSMLGIFIFRLLRAYLIVQRSVLASFVVTFIGVILLIPFNYAFIYLFHLKLVGIAIGSDVCYCLMVIFMVLYILVTRIYEETWPGFSLRCLLDWKSYLTLALPAALSFLLKSSVHEIALIAIGTVGEVEVAAQTALFTIMKAMLTLAFAIGMPMNINIAKYFGEKNPDESRRVAIVGCFISLVASLVLAACFIAVKDVIGGIFTNDVAVQILIGKVTPFAAFSFVLESITTVIFINFLSLRLQMHSVVIYFITCYLIGLPLGISLALYRKDISLLWCGLAVGFCVQFLLFSILIFWKVDFERISEERQETTGTMKRERKYSAEYLPVKTYDENKDELDERGGSKIKNKLENEKDNEKRKLISSDIESEAEKSFAERKDDTTTENEELSLQLIGKRCLVFGITIIFLVISIIIRIEIG